MYLFFHLNCNTQATSLINNVTAVLREIILTLVYFRKMARIVISLITTVPVLEIYLTNRLWFMAIESLTNKVNDSIAK